MRYKFSSDDKISKYLQLPFIAKVKSVTVEDRRGAVICELPNGYTFNAVFGSNVLDDWGLYLLVSGELVDGVDYWVEFYELKNGELAEISVLTCNGFDAMYMPQDIYARDYGKLSDVNPLNYPEWKELHKVKSSLDSDEPFYYSWLSNV